MIERMLVPLDGSRLAESVLPTAAALLKPGRGTLILLHALTPAHWFSALAAGFVRRERRRAAAYLARVAARMRREGLRVETRVAEGEAAEVITKTAHREAAELITLSGRGHGRGGDWPLGSVAERVVRTADLPVLLFRGMQGRRHAIRKVLVPLDGTEASLAVMPVVGDTAGALGARVALLHVGRRRARAMANAMDVLARLGIPGRIYIRPGRPVEIIEGVADELEADLVAISARRRRGKKRLFFGPVVEGVLRRSDRPLLVVHSNGAP